MGPGLMLSGVYHTLPRTTYFCSLPSKVSPICRLTSNDVSVSVLRVRLDFPPANRTLPTSAAAGESLVVGLATLKSVPFSLDKNVMCSRYSVSMRFARGCAGRGRCLSSRYIVLFPPPGQGGHMIVVFYRSDGRGFVVWGRTRDERHFLKCTGSGCLFLRVL